MHDQDDDNEYSISKSQKKRDMQALQDLGAELTELSAGRLKKVPMSERLMEALQEMLKLTKHEARRRQLQFIGRLMRDEDTAPIRAALEALKGKSREENARLHRLERLRERLLEDESVASEIAAQYPDADLQRLRQLRRNAIKEQAETRPPRAYREIFQILKDLEAAAQPDTDEADEGEQDE